MSPERGRTPRRPRKRREDPIREAASEAAENGGNGNDDWVDYETPADSWDPWEEGEGEAGARSLDRMLFEWFDAVVPPEAQVHFFNAGREFAAGLQVTFEYHVRRSESAGDAARPTRIEIE